MDGSCHKMNVTVPGKFSKWQLQFKGSHTCVLLSDLKVNLAAREIWGWGGVAPADHLLEMLGAWLSSQSSGCIHFCFDDPEQICRSGGHQKALSACVFQAWEKENQHGSQAYSGGVGNGSLQASFTIHMERTAGIGSLISCFQC